MEGCHGVKALFAALQTDAVETTQSHKLKRSSLKLTPKKMRPMCPCSRAVSHPTFCLQECSCWTAGTPFSLLGTSGESRNVTAMRGLPFLPEDYAAFVQEAAVPIC